MDVTHYPAGDASAADKITKGMTAGLVATLLLSLLNLMLYRAPHLDIVTLLDGVSRSLLEPGWWPPARLTGWLEHLLIGTVWWGAVFGLLEPILPGQSYLTRGLYFGLGCAFLVMLMVMPMAGAGYFGMELSLTAPVMTLLMQLIYGAALGLTYGRLVNAHPRRG